MIDYLEELLYCLQSVDAEWRNKFHENWFVLEQMYAVLLYRNESIEREDSDIQELLEKLSFY